MLAFKQSLTNKRIGLLTASASRLGGGVFEAVLAQAEIIKNFGAEPLVFALEDEHSSEDRARFGQTEVRTFGVRGPRQIGYAPELLAGLNSARLDCLHLHGIWMYPSRAGKSWADASGGGYIISPHGMLESWITAHGRWKKALARVGYERSGWKRASFLHALTSHEAADIDRECGRIDSWVIANAAPSVRAEANELRLPHFAYIGRIHPKKNLLALVAAWSELDRPADALLTIAGWGDPTDVAALEAAVQSAGTSVQFVGPVFGAAKLKLISQARFMVLPSLSEGLPMAILEGWAEATPSIMTVDCNLPEGFAADAALECGSSTGAIKLALKQALALSQTDWHVMSANARRLAAGPFSAESISAKWSDAYASAIALGSKVVP